jgi:large subunit ribosomal protein L23
MNAYQVIIRPLITEKNTNLMELNKYSFEVDRKANKHEIKHAIQEIFKVTVVDVNTINMRGKERRRGRIVGRTADWKKAVVTLAQGDRIELFEI